jgi:hypothetical protein
VRCLARHHGILLIISPCCHTAEDPKKNKPKWCKEAWAHSDAAGVKDGILKADVIVFDIVHAQKEVTAALKILLKAEYEEEKTLIAVSSIMSWADTLPPKPSEDDEPVEEVAGQPEQACAVLRALTQWQVKRRLKGSLHPKPPSLLALPSRSSTRGSAGRTPGAASPNFPPLPLLLLPLHPCRCSRVTPCMRSLRALQTTENLILQKGNVPKDQLRTYVVWPGVLCVNP